jgi:hypothetical protein
MTSSIPPCPVDPNTKCLADVSFQDLTPMTLATTEVRNRTTMAVLTRSFPFRLSDIYLFLRVQ